MSGYNTPALDDVTNGDDHAGEEVTPEHDVDTSRFAEEDDSDD